MCVCVGGRESDLNRRKRCLSDVGACLEVGVEIGKLLTRK